MTYIKYYKTSFNLQQTLMSFFSLLIFWVKRIIFEIGFGNESQTEGNQRFFT